MGDCGGSQGWPLGLRLGRRGKPSPERRPWLPGPPPPIFLGVLQVCRCLSLTLAWQRPSPPLGTRVPSRAEECEV